LSLPPLTVSPGKIREDLLTSLRVPAVENLAEQLPVRFPRPHIARERLLPSSRFLALLRKRDFRVVRRSTTAPPPFSSFLNFLTVFAPRKTLQCLSTATHLSFTFMAFVIRRCPRTFRFRLALLDLIFNGHFHGKPWKFTRNRSFRASIIFLMPRAITTFNIRINAPCHLGRYAS